MTVPTNSLTPLGPDDLSATVHSGSSVCSARTRLSKVHHRQLSLSAPCTLPRHTHPPDPPPPPLLFLTQQDRHPRGLPQSALPALSLVSSPTTFLNHVLPRSPSPSFTLSTSTTFPRTRPPRIPTPACPSPSPSPRTALPQFPPQGLTLFSPNHFFSNTIATDWLPLADGPFVALEIRRQQLWPGCG
jgi:hypothetical protein